MKKAEEIRGAYFALALFTGIYAASNTTLCRPDYFIQQYREAAPAACHAYVGVISAALWPIYWLANVFLVSREE